MILGQSLRLRGVGGKIIYLQIPSTNNCVLQVGIINPQVGV